MNENEVRNVTRKFLDEEHLLGFIKVFEKEHNLFRGSHDRIQLPAALNIPDQIINQIVEKFDTQLTEGSIPFIGEDKHFTELNDELFYDETKKILCLGLSSPETDMVGGYIMKEGTPPTQDIVDCFHAYAKDTPLERLTDGELETWASAEELTNWTEFDGGTPQEGVYREASVVHGGTYSCKLVTDTAGDYAGFQQDLILNPGYNCRIAIWYIRTAHAGSNLRLYLYDDGPNVYLQDDGTWDAASNFFDLPVAEVWTLFELEFVAHANYTNYTVKIYKSHSSGAAVSFYVDDVSVSENKNVVPYFRTEAGITIGLNQDMRTTASVVHAGLTLTQFSGVLKAVDGVVTEAADHVDLANITANQHHAQLHAAQHEVGGGDLLAFADIPDFGDWLDQAVKQASNVSFGTIGCGTITIANGSSLNLQEDITFTGATAQNLIKFPDNLPTALDFREGATSYLLFRTSNGTEGITIGKALTLSSIAAGGADYDKFLVSHTGLIKYRTGAQVLSDIGAQPLDAELTAIAGLTSSAGKYIRFTGSGTADLRTYANVLADLSGSAGAAFAWNGQNLTGIGTIGSGAITSTGTSTLAKLGIGGTPTGKLHVISDAATFNYIYFDTYGEGETNVLVMRKSYNDTVGVVTETPSSSILGQIQFHGVNDTPAFGLGAYISAVQDGASGSFVPTNLFFNVYEAETSHMALVLHNDGKVAIGPLGTPDYQLEVFSTTQPQFAVTHTDNVDYLTIDVNSDGNATIIASGGTIAFSGVNVRLKSGSDVSFSMARANGTFAFEIFRDVTLGTDTLRTKLSNDTTWHNFITMGEGDASHAAAKLILQAQGGNTGFGTAAPGAFCDVSWGGYQGTGALRIGADMGNNVSRTDNTRKFGILAFPHYTNAEENILGISLDTYASNNIMAIGGGVASWNAINEFHIYTAVGATTTTGTRQFTIAGDGTVYIAGPVAIGRATPIFALDIAGNNIGLGATTPTDSHHHAKAIYLGDRGAVYGTAAALGFFGLFLSDNSYMDVDTGLFSYTTSSFATQIHQDAGVIKLQTALSGVAGNTVTWANGILVYYNGKVFLPGIATTDAGDYDLRYDAADGIVYNTSDIRQKENQVPLEYGLSEILQLQPKRYTYHVGLTGTEEDRKTKKMKRKAIEITDKSRESFGLIAQEVFDIIPEAVYKPEDEKFEFWGLRENRLIPVMVNAIKELSKKIESLEEFDEELKAKLEEYQPKIDAFLDMFGIN